VIFNKDLASFYLRLCTGLGVQINVNKSVVATDRAVVEFAKRTGLNGFDVSALSIKEFINCNNFFGRLELARRLIERH